MTERALVELTIRYGDYGHEQKTVAVPITEDLTRELLGRVELSDEPFSLFVASHPGKDALTFRRLTFKMRRQVANDIARAMVPALLKAFGVNDTLDGYRLDELSEDERAWHVARGRLPR